MVNEGQEGAINYGNQMDIARITYNKSLPFNERFRLQINKVSEASIMDSVAIHKLKERADAIAKFRELTIEEQEWIFPLLSRGIQATIELLDIISEKPLTYEEIADELDIHPTTVTQKLNALAAGGYPLDLTDVSAFAPTGRPRKLARKADIRAKLQSLINEIEETE